MFAFLGCGINIVSRTLKRNDNMTIGVIGFHKARSVAEPATYSQDCEKDGILVINI